MPAIKIILVKPNTNTTNQIAEAADKTVDIAEVIEPGVLTRTEESPAKPATARPEKENPEE